MPEPKDVPTFPVKAPDGEKINVPDLPGLGEQYHATTPEVPSTHAALEKSPRIPSPPKTDALSKVESTITRGAQRIWNDVAGDDINTLSNPKASAVMKTLAAVDIVTTVVPGEGEVKETLEIAGKEAVKDAAASPATRKIAVRALTEAREMGRGFVEFFKTSTHTLLEKVRTPRGRGVVAAEVAATIVGGAAYDKITNALQDHRPTYWQGDSKHRMADGYTMTGKVEIEGAYIVQSPLNGGPQVMYRQTQLEAHATKKSDFPDLMKAAKSGSIATISYSGGISVQVVTREPLAYMIGHSRHLMQDGFHSEGRLEHLQHGEIAQVSPHHPTRIFNRLSLIEHSANPSEMERTIATAIETGCDVTINYKNGNLFVTPRERSNVHQQRRGR